MMDDGAVERPREMKDDQDVFKECRVQFTSSGTKMILIAFDVSEMPVLGATAKLAPESENVAK